MLSRISNKDKCYENLEIKRGYAEMINLVAQILTVPLKLPLKL